MSSRPESIFTPIANTYQAKPDGRSRALARTYAELAALDTDAPRVKGHAVSWACGVLADSYSADGLDGSRAATLRELSEMLPRDRDVAEDGVALFGDGGGSVEYRQRLNDRIAYRDVVSFWGAVARNHQRHIVALGIGDGVVPVPISSDEYGRAKAMANRWRHEHRVLNDALAVIP